MPTECRVPENSKESKKYFLREQCQKIKENNRMGKTRDLFKKIVDTWGTFHAKMTTIKNRNSKDLTEAEEIKKMQKKYTDELSKKGLNVLMSWITMMVWSLTQGQTSWSVKPSGPQAHLGIITMNKASGGDGISAELFQILKDDAVKVLHSTCQQIWKTQQWPQDWKRAVFIPTPKKGNTEIKPVNSKGTQS